MEKGKSMVFWLLLFMAGQVKAQSLTTEWSHAEAIYTKGSNVIKWTTAYESGCKEYIVEKSTDGNTWQAIATPLVARNSSGPNYYQLNDPAVTSTITWYRIRRTDIDGSTAYSVMLIAQKGKGIVVQIYTYPLPGDFTISAGQSLKTVQVYNADDSLMYVTVMDGISYHTINSKNFPGGKYYTLVELADGNVVKEYFTKQ